MPNAWASLRTVSRGGLCVTPCSSFCTIASERPAVLARLVWVMCLLLRYVEISKPRSVFFIANSFTLRQRAVQCWEMLRGRVVMINGDNGYCPLVVYRLGTDCGCWAEIATTAAVKIY